MYESAAKRAGLKLPRENGVNNHVNYIKIRCFPFKPLTIGRKKFIPVSGGEKFKSVGRSIVKSISEKFHVKIKVSLKILGRETNKFS